MKQENYQYFVQLDKEGLLKYLEKELEIRNESPIWRERVVPFSSAVLSVLIPLAQQNLLFNPEGEHEKDLTPEVFFRWCDFVSLKMLAFTLQYSNDAGELLRTSLPESQTKQYKEIDLEELGAYLSKYNVNLENEHLDFPIANYNLHEGVANVIKSLL